METNIKKESIEEEKVNDKKNKIEKIMLDKEEEEIIDLLLSVLKEFKLETTLRIAGGWVRDKVKI